MSRNTVAMSAHLLATLSCHSAIVLASSANTAPARCASSKPRESAASRNAALSTTIFWWMPSHVVAPAL
ncbi:hypothetical protein BEL07_27705 [Mycolicibacterium grossiae]|uniref:Secreted protein n=1 Tax=Mycolicibacterium grossiae TaxID=1552759 RepID=A0A1E8PWV0_9MYCO|nr:hypothetical protein BEL07_27705 [Mycolicibacterium grossiae]